MDPIYYVRVASAGWIVVAVVMTSLWAADADQWRLLAGITQTSQAGVALALLAAVAGVGAPPVVGIVLERLVKILLLSLRRDLWNYTFIDEFHGIYKRIRPSDSEVVSPGGIFHVALYSMAEPSFVAWLRRRISHQFSSVTSALAILVGLAIAGLVFSAFATSVIVVSLVLVFGLVSYAEIEHRVVSEAGHAWTRSLGYKLARDLAAAGPDSQQPGQPEARRA